MTKKHFYFLITSSKPATYGGRKQTAQIYTVKRGQIVHCGATTWKTATFMGAKSEIFNFLMNRGYIPKKYAKSSESPYCAGGYFQGAVCDKYSIEEMATK